MMQLSVKTLDSLTHNFTDLDEEITVMDFKSYISSTVTLPPEQQRLIFRGRVLQDDKKLRDYNVTSGQVIHLVARNPTESSPANDHPQPQNAQTTGPGGAGGRNNAIIMGTIGTLEFANTPPLGLSGTTPGRRNSAAVRIQVANQCLRRASDRLQMLEDEAALIQPPERQDGVASEEASEDESMLETIALQHAAATATVMTSVLQEQSGQAQPRNVYVPSVHSASTTTDGNAPNSNQESDTVESGYVTPSNTGTSTPRPEAPMLHELATAINDYLALNSRLTPYLQTVQRWLAENGDVSQNQEAVQYTYDTVSSILHSVSHSVHALSDISVDFSIPQAQRRLRAPTTVWVEQSPLMRATIPIGVHVGVEATTTAPNGTEAPPAGSGMPLPQHVTVQGVLPPGVGGGMQIQQMISNLIQGVMSGQIQPSQQPPSTSNGSPMIPPTPPIVNLNNNTVPRVDVQLQPQPVDLSRMFAPGQMSYSMPMPPPVSTPVSAAATPPAGGHRSRTQSPQPPRHVHTFNPADMPHMPPPRMPSLEQIILQCRSHHYGNSSGSQQPPPRPENLSGFLSQENSTPVTEDTQVFQTVAALVQGLNLVHPIVAQYMKSTVLRGRDCNNPGHVTTGIRGYARKLVDWIVASISASRRETFDKPQLTSKLLELVTSLISKATHVVLSTPAGSVITPALGVLLNEFMPTILDTLEVTFGRPEHLRVFKGIILLIVCTCFPGTSVMFTTRLAAGIADHLIHCAPVPREVTQQVNVMETEVSMEIGFEISDVGDSSNDTQSVTTERIEPQGGDTRINVPSISISNTTLANGCSTSTPQRPGVNIKAEPKVTRGGSGDAEDGEETDEEDLQAQLNDITSTLFRDVPPAWGETLLMDINRQDALRQNLSSPEASAGFRSIFPKK